MNASAAAVSPSSPLQSSAPSVRPVAAVAAVDGVFALNKARGETSAKAAAAVRKLLGAKKAGHGGALDPLADGLVVVLLGAATALARFALGGDKRYRAVIRFGFATDTDDAEGRPLGPPQTPDLSGLPRLLPAFVGEFQQAAPRHSALKHQGRPLYYYARRGLDAPVKRRAATVHALELLRVGGDFAEVDLRCAAGFYVRSLARDLGEQLGCGGHLAGLTRTRSGGLTVEQAASLAALREMNPEQRAACVLPPETVIAHWPAATLSLPDVTALAHGGAVAAAELAGEAAEGTELRLRAPDGRFAGAGRLTENELRPLAMMPWTRGGRPETDGGRRPEKKSGGRAAGRRRFFNKQTARGAAPLRQGAS